jgi:hypothetical protein
MVWSSPCGLLAGIIPVAALLAGIIPVAARALRLSQMCLGLADVAGGHLGDVRGGRVLALLVVPERLLQVCGRLAQVRSGLPVMVDRTVDGDLL